MMNVCDELDSNDDKIDNKVNQNITHAGYNMI